MNLVEEEMVADNALAVLSDEKAIQELAKDNKTLLQKIGAFFRNLADKLKAIKEKLSKSSVVYSEVNHDIEFLEQSAEKIRTMLDSVKETASKQSDTVKYSKNTDFPNQVDEWYRNGHDNNETFIIGDTGDVLQGLGAIDNRIYFYGSKINAILKKHSDTMSLDIIKKVPDIIDNPALVLSSHSRSQENNTRLLMFGMVKDINGKPVMAVLDLQPFEKGLLISDMQKLTSAYSLTRGQKGIYDYLNNCDVLYVTENKNIATKLVRQIGFVDPKKGLPIGFQQSGYIGNISYSNQIVKIQGIPFSEVFNAKADNVNKKFSKNTGYIKNFSQCDRVVESLDKYLSKKYDDTFELDGTKVEFVSIEQSYGMGSYATFYIDFSINETEGITIRYSGHENSTADYYLWNDDFSSMKEIKNAIDDIVEQEVKIEMPKRQQLIKEVMAKRNKSDIRYSKDTNFTKALTGDEKKKYNNAIMTGNDNGLRISDNSILVECENKSEYQYKYVVYDEFEDGQRITDVYAIGKIDTNVEDNVPSQYHNIAEYINKVRDLGYDNRKNIRNLYKDFMRDTSYVLVQYNKDTSKFNVIGRGSVKNGTNTFDKFVGRGSSREDTGSVQSDTGRFSRNTRLNYDENFDDVNEAFEQALNVLQNVKGIDISSKVVEEIGNGQKSTFNKRKNQCPY